MNKVILIGISGKDPDIHNGDNFKVATFSFATSETFKDKAGERQTLTEWHTIKCFSKLADFAENWVKKGSKLVIEGHIKTDKYEKAGGTKFSTYIKAEKISFNGKSESKPEETTPVVNNENETGNDDGDDLPF